MRPLIAALAIEMNEDICAAKPAPSDSTKLHRPD